MIRIALISLALLAIVTPAVAQNAAASGTLELRRSLTVSTARPMAPSSDPDAALSPTMEEGVYQITGDPDRVYRVRTETATGEAADVSAIESRNAGDISDGGLARLDAEGRDFIRIVPRSDAAGGTPSTPLTLLIDYE